MFARKAAVLVEGATDLTIEAGEFFDLGGNAVVVSGFNRRVRILDNEFRDIGPAPSRSSQPEAVRSPRFNYDAPAAYASADMRQVRRLRPTRQTVRPVQPHSRYRTVEKQVAGCRSPWPCTSA